MKKAPPVPTSRSQYFLKINRIGILIGLVDLKFERRKSLESSIRSRKRKTNSGSSTEMALTAKYAVWRLSLDANRVIKYTKMQTGPPQQVINVVAATYTGPLWDGL